MRCARKPGGKGVDAQGGAVCDAGAMRPATERVFSAQQKSPLWGGGINDEGRNHSVSPFKASKKPADFSMQRKILRASKILPNFRATH
jgi:hypothetical protein